MDAKLELLLADGVIDEVLGRLKSGKEANISLVRRGEDVVAAKVYKDRSTRSFKNNADYKEGRKVRNSRTQRSIDSGGQFGRAAAEQAWKSAEADALYKLVGSGVRVPAPVMFYEGVLLMDLVCDAEGRPAARLIDVALDKDSALALYADLVAQIIAMLCCDLIHGDLSPYNILAAADGPTIIDFPQVISAVHSSRAEFFFLRDFDNIVRFVSTFDPSLAVHTADGRAIWRAYVSRDLTPQYVPPPPPPPRPTRGPDRRSRPDERRNGHRDERRPDNRPQQQRTDNRPQQQRTDNRPQQQRTDNRPPMRTNDRPPIRTDNRPPQQRTDNRPPQQRTDNRPPMHTDNRPPQPRTDNRPPQLRTDNRPPMRTDNRPPQQRTDNRPPQQRTDNRPPQQRTDDRPPMRTDDRPPMRTDNRPPMRTDNRPPMRTDNRPPMRTDNRPPMRTDNRPPPPRTDNRPAPRAGEWPSTGTADARPEGASRGRRRRPKRRF